MKYRPDDYAKALADVILAGEDEARVIKNFLALLERNTDLGQLSTILDRADRLIRRQTGRRKVTVESARPLSPQDKKDLAGVFGREDDVEEKIAAELVAGVRITVDDELQFDGSLRRKLDNLFAQ